jgi:hypothetical protein
MERFIRDIGLLVNVLVCDDQHKDERPIYTHSQKYWCQEIPKYIEVSL